MNHPLANLQPTNKREIRSYVVRSRTSKSQKRALSELSNQFAIELNLEKNSIHPSQFFQVNQLPVALEIGFGMGENLLNNAQGIKNINWIGVETHNAGVGRVFNLVDKNGLDNLKIYHGDVQIFLSKILDESLAWVQIFFPDPWPKKRHHKRRLINRSFMHLLHQKMRPKARLEIATDWQNYATQISELFSELDISDESHLSCSALFENQFKLNLCPRSENRVLTNFEKKAIAAKRQIFDFCLIRK